MKYMGSKSRFAKSILPIMLKDRDINQPYVEPFVGGCNSIDKVGGKRLASDNNKYLIAMWRALQKGWEPPKEITREFYSQCRDAYSSDSALAEDLHVIGYVGFNGSYGGRFYDGGYAGVSVTKDGTKRNYPLEAYNNVIAQVPSIRDIEFTHGDYAEMTIPPSSVIYCDIPYRGTKTYKGAEYFEHAKFWSWCRGMSLRGHKVYVSEYSAPDDFECVWEKETSSSLRANGVVSGSKRSIERLFTLTACEGGDKMKQYKELRKKLNKKFTNPYTTQEGYSVRGALKAWVEQSGIKWNINHSLLLEHINGGTVYPYQKADRKRIRNYLKRNKKWNQ